VCRGQTGSISFLLIVQILSHSCSTDEEVTRRRHTAARECTQGGSHLINRGPRAHGMWHLHNTSANAAASRYASCGGACVRTRGHTW
jgi:hypothetical protein